MERLCIHCGNIYDESLSYDEPTEYDVNPYCFHRAYDNTDYACAHDRMVTCRDKVPEDISLDYNWLESQLVREM